MTQLLEEGFVLRMHVRVQMVQNKVKCIHPVLIHIHTYKLHPLITKSSAAAQCSTDTGIWLQTVFLLTAYCWC